MGLIDRYRQKTIDAAEGHWRAAISTEIIMSCVAYRKNGVACEVCIEQADMILLRGINKRIF